MSYSLQGTPNQTPRETLLFGNIQD